MVNTIKLPQNIYRFVFWIRLFASAYFLSKTKASLVRFMQLIVSKKSTQLKNHLRYFELIF